MRRLPAKPSIFCSTRRASSVASGIAALGAGPSASAVVRPKRAEAEAEVAFERAHVEQDHRPLRPVVDEIGAQEVDGVAQHRRENADQPHRRALARHVRRHQQAEEAGAFAVAHRLEVGVLVGVEDAGDGDAFAQVAVGARGHADERLGVGADEAADAVGEPRQSVARWPSASAAAAPCRSRRPRRSRCAR